jgi:ABC-type antimicrobial peptide transport system permease subunit
MTLEDGQAILAAVPGIRRMSPVVSDRTQVKYGNQNTRTDVIGVAPTYFGLRNYVIERGRPFTEADVDGFARVCTIGSKAAEDLFGQDDPLGETIRVKNVNLRIIGVQKTKGEQGWHNPDDNVHVPYTVAMQQLFGQDNVDQIYMQLAEGTNLEDVEPGIRAVLRLRHSLMSDEEDDFHIHAQTQWMQSAVESSQTFTFLLAGIASISLLVGGIGIMNIMLVTVTERTKEIGVRKAIGAKERSILLQFLIEAVIVSGLGGMVGVAVGVGGAVALAAWTEFTTIVEIDSVLLALSVSAFVGVFFGFYPARRAASLDPVEALRYE